LGHRAPAAALTAGPVRVSTAADAAAIVVAMAFTIAPRPARPFTFHGISFHPDGHTPPVLWCRHFGASTSGVRAASLRTSARLATEFGSDLAAIGPDRQVDYALTAERETLRTIAETSVVRWEHVYHDGDHEPAACVPAAVAELLLALHEQRTDLADEFRRWIADPANFADATTSAPPAGGAADGAALGKA
jgi:hypothetical protein